MSFVPIVALSTILTILTTDLEVLMMRNVRLRSSSTFRPVVSTERNEAMITVNSIEIPEWLVGLCADWYDGMDDKLYAVCSTGGLTLGNHRPLGCNTDEKWYLTIWRNFAVDMRSAVNAARRRGDEDCDALIGSEEWINERCLDIEEAFGLEGWGG